MSGKAVVAKDGRFGVYVTDGETNASLGKGDRLEAMPLERAYELLALRREAIIEKGGPAAKKLKATTKKAAPAKKAAAKKGPGEEGRREEVPAARRLSRADTSARTAGARRSPAAAPGATEPSPTRRSESHVRIRVGGAEPSRWHRFSRASDSYRLVGLAESEVLVRVPRVNPSRRC